MKKPRPKKCKVCEERFQPERHMQPCCSPKCAFEKIDIDKKKKQRKDLAIRKKKALTRTEILAKAQKAFNEFIRYRDRNKPCIVCNTHHQAQYHAGHLYTRKSRPDLRFNENNCFKQCAQTNKFTSVDTAEKFLENVIARIGQEEFDNLQVVGRSDWSREEIEKIEKEYKKKLKNKISG